MAWLDFALATCSPGSTAIQHLTFSVVSQCFICLLCTIILFFTISFFRRMNMIFNTNSHKKCLNCSLWWKEWDFMALWISLFNPAVGVDGKLCILWISFVLYYCLIPHIKTHIFSFWPKIGWDLLMKIPVCQYISIYMWRYLYHKYMAYLHSFCYSKWQTSV